MSIYKTKRIIEVSDWDQLVEDTYKVPYAFQQQDGCKDRGTVSITIPHLADDYQNDTVPEIINGEEMGVSFQAWLARDPKEWYGNPKDAKSVDLWWQRNFYPDVQMTANDLHAKGLIEAGE